MDGAHERATGASALVDWAEEVRCAATGLAWTARYRERGRDAETVAAIEQLELAFEQLEQALSVLAQSETRAGRPHLSLVRARSSVADARRACAVPRRHVGAGRG